MTNFTPTGMDPIRTVQILRKGIGTVSIAMPFILIFLSLIPFFQVNGIQISLSAYYYTNIREVFTGILFIVGFFLLVYQSDYVDPELQTKENLLVRIMGFAAIGVALIPTECNPKYAICQGMPSFIPNAGNFASTGHIIATIILFLTFAYVSYYIFPNNKDSEKNNKKKDEKNENTYRICALIIIGALLLLVINALLNFYNELELHTHMTLISETIILLSFGYSWFTKGKAEKNIL